MTIIRYLWKFPSWRQFLISTIQNCFNFLFALWRFFQFWAESLLFSKSVFAGFCFFLFQFSNFYKIGSFFNNKLNFQLQLFVLFTPGNTPLIMYMWRATNFISKLESSNSWITSIVATICWMRFKFFINLHKELNFLQ